MKKSIFVVLSLSSLLLLGSCGRGQTSSSAEPAPVSSSSENIQSISSSSSTNSSSSSTNNDAEKIYTIAELIALMPADNSASTERYYVRGRITSITNANYGAMVIEDSTGSLAVYGTYSSDGAKRYSELDDKPVKGDDVLLYATIQNYNGTTYEIKSGWIIEITHNTDVSSYEQMTIAEARNAEEGKLVKVTGTVATITYTQSMAANGIILVGDNSSIYVHDSVIAASVKVGNTVTIIGKKTYYVSSSESANATKYGYKGSCQISDAYLNSNDNEVSTLDYSFAKEVSVKDIMDTSYSENITSLIYHSTAIIKKVEGKGFTNYYIDDLDQKTGSYVYTSNSGSDFSWLDEFDGKICSVYYTPLNAKSSASGCIWRFIPLQVEAIENYEFDKAEANAFAINYYTLDQFEDTYNSDPSLELITSVSSDLLNFGTVSITYTSSDFSVFSIENSEDGKAILHGHGNGKANITITAHLDGYEDYSSIVELKYVDLGEIEAITVKQAIDSTKGGEITVKGIAGPSLINQTGFYLIDDSGVIAVTLSKDDLGKISFGDQVYLKGTRDYKTKTGNESYGQEYISDCTILKNEYGNHSYSTATFQDSTIAELYSADATNTTLTAGVYKVTGGIKKVSTAYYTNYSIINGSDSVTLYSSSGNQYAWLDQFLNDGQDTSDEDLTIEVALCNWNSKSYFRGCVLSVTDKDGNQVFNTYNYSSN